MKFHCGLTYNFLYFKQLRDSPTSDAISLFVQHYVWEQIVKANMTKHCTEWKMKPAEIKAYVPEEKSQIYRAKLNATTSGYNSAIFKVPKMCSIAIR